MKKIENFGDQHLIIYSYVRLGFCVVLSQEHLIEDDKHDHLFYVTYPDSYKKHSVCRSFTKYPEALAFYKSQVSNLVKRVPIRKSMFLDWRGEVMPF